MTANTRSRRRTPIVLAVVAAIAAIVLIAFVTRQGETPEPVVERGGDLPSEIEALVPEPGDTIRLQERVGVDLRDDLTGRLLIDGVSIPDDQIVSEGGGRLFFQPGGDRELERIQPGQHVATVIYWDATETETDGAQNYSWNFRTG